MSERERAAGPGLPARGEWLFRDAYVVSLDEALGDLPRADVQAMARSGTRLSLSPQTELRTMGFPQLAEMLAAGVNVSLSVEMARVADAPLSPRRVLRLATLDGARDLGLADRIGSITPGKRADFFLARMGDWNLVPCSDPVDVLVLAGQPANVDTVVVDGRILKRGGSLVGVDPRRVKGEAVSALVGLLEHAGRRVPDHVRGLAERLAVETPRG